MSCRSVRGAITVKRNNSEEILEATTEVLVAIVAANKIKLSDIVNVLFTVTSDLDTDFPARAARQMGWDLVPMMCSYEIAVPGSLKKCIRVMLTFNSRQTQSKIRHQYLREAIKLRPDLVQK